MSKRKNEKLYYYLVLVLTLYGLTLLIWPMAVFGIGMSFAAPFPVLA